MANNELSGPILLNAVLKHLKENYKKPYYTYRFVLMPETIGSIAYLSKKYKYLRKNVIAAFNLTCVGDNKNYSMIESRTGNTLSDKALKCQIIKNKNKIYSFLHVDQTKDNIAHQELIYQWLHFVDLNLEIIKNIILVLII